MWHVAEEIGKKEGRFDISVAAAGIWGGDIPSLEYPEEEFQEVSALDTHFRTHCLTGILLRLSIQI